jgi:hypothetical protein
VSEDAVVPSVLLAEGLVVSDKAPWLRCFLTRFPGRHLPAILDVRLQPPFIRSPLASLSSDMVFIGFVSRRYEHVNSSNRSVVDFSPVSLYWITIHSSIHLFFFSRISDSHGGEYEDGWLLGCSAV